MSQASLCIALINNLSENIKDSIVNPKANILKKFIEKEKQEVVRVLTDLRDIKSKSEGEVYEILNAMVKNSQFFMYCGPLLLNINPGPNYIKDYLNLQAWVKETEAKDESTWKPHLYSFMYYVYQTMVSEKRDQAVNMLGQIGSGKTFNIIHIIEYFCCMVGPEGNQIEVFDKIHKSIQLIHIMGSIFRENNLESTSCGILLRLGFGEDNKISTFDIEAKILDCTLPFSENGRSFSILHSFMAAASNDLKRSFNLPDNEIHLNFFRKFSNSFSSRTKDRFKLNDYEIWNRFHSLLHSFNFHKEEVIEILKLFSFIIMVNELGISKSQDGNKGTIYTVNKGHCSKKLAKNFNISEDDLIRAFGKFKSIEDVKTLLVGLIKYTYYIVFEYIQRKIKESLREFFQGINPKRNSQQATKYISFLDFPGEVDDSTLGGLLTNLSNECINLFAGNSYSSVVEKLQEEKVNMKLFEPLHCYHVVKAFMGDKGLFSYLSMPFTEDNYSSLRKEANTKKHFKASLKFIEDNKPGKGADLKFKVNYSSKSIVYNYESLYQETKSMVNTDRLLRIFSLSSNCIIKSTYQHVVDAKKDFFKHAYSSIMALFKPIEGLSPFIIYCLHSNNSLKLFFDNKGQADSAKEWDIPRDLTMGLLKKSLCIPVLYWEWFGYSDWVETDSFLKMFAKDFEKIESRLPKTSDLYGKSIAFAQLNSSIEKVSFIVNGLLRNCDYVQGKHHVIMKKGTLSRIAEKIKALNELSQIQSDSRKGSLKSSESKTSKGLSSKGKSLPKNSTGSRPPSSIPKKKEPIKQASTMKEAHTASKSQLTIERRNTMKTQCQINIIDSSTAQAIAVPSLKAGLASLSTNTNTTPLNERDTTSTQYNVYRIFDRCPPQMDTLKSETEEVSPSLNEGDIEDFRKKNNIVIPNKNAFSLVQNLFDPSKNKNFKIFDYTKCSPAIIKIQCFYRVMQARRKHLILRFILKKIVLLQAHTKRFVTKAKFEQFKKCLRCVLLIQRVYRRHLNSLINSVIAIQSNVRRWIQSVRATRKLLRYRECTQSNEQFFDSSDEEKKAQLQLLEEAKRKSAKSSKTVKTSNSIKSVKAPFVVETAKNLKERAPKKGRKQYIDISSEKNKEKIISMILRDQELLKENEAVNRKLANQKGVAKEIQYELLQREDRTQSKMRIEDKLIEYGEIMKQKRAQEKVDKLKFQEMQYSFKPQLKQSQLSYSKVKELNANSTSFADNIVEKDFYARAAFFEETKGSHIESIKTTIVDPDLAEYTFKPKLSRHSQGITRTIDDLYAWKQKTEKNRMELLKKKELKESEEMSKHSISFINEKSRTMLDKRAIRQENANFKGMSRMNKTIEYEENNEDMAQEDMWPAELNKLYG